MRIFFLLRVLIKFTATNDGCKLIVKESNWNDSDSPQGLKKIAELITIMQPDQLFLLTSNYILKNKII